MLRSKHEQQPKEHTRVNKPMLFDGGTNKKLIKMHSF